MSLALLTYLLLASVRVMSAPSSQRSGSLTIVETNDSIEYAVVLSKLKTSPNDVELLLQASGLEARFGGRMKSGKQKSMLLANARVHAMRAIAAAPSNVEAHFNFIIALGLLAESSCSPKGKLEFAKTIKAEADLILRLDSTHAGAYYVLAKWHEALSNISIAERIFCNMFFGGVPSGASMDRALMCYKRAIGLRPDFILFHYGLAHALASRGDNTAAAQLLHHAISLPISEPDDLLRKRNCVSLLNKIKPSTL